MFTVRLNHTSFTSRNLTAIIKRFGACRSGASAIEYTLFAGGVMGAIILGVDSVGDALNEVLTDTGNATDTSASTGGSGGSGGGSSGGVSSTP